MWTSLLTVGLQVLGWFLEKNQGDKEMQKLFFEFISRIQSMYLKSVHGHDEAKRLKKEMDEKLAKEGFKESP